MSFINQRPHNLLRFLYYPLATIFLIQIAPAKAAIHPVLTHQNGSTSFGQLVTSSTLVWVTYDSKDSKQLQHAVEGGKYITEDEHYPIYVCRVTIDGAPTSGHTEKIMQAHVCVAAHYKHTKYEKFDVLINKGHLGKIAWKHWRKFNAGIPIGAISIGEGTFIARHHAPLQQNHAESSAQWGADYNLGRLEMVGLGKIKVVENESDKDYEEGDVLVETEPFRYELRDIKLDKIRLDMTDNITDLASSVLVNNGDKYSLVETAMSYQFDHVQNWGLHEGVARGLPTKIFEKDVNVPAEINWGLKHIEKRFETKSVHTNLLPGTALNVTLRGNYVHLRAPYTAKLYVFYHGIEESVSRKISSEVQKSYLKDVKLEYSPMYWEKNGTIVPTTTTSTTSTTTHATTTSTGEPAPMHEPPVVHVKDIGESHSGPDSLEKSLHDSPDSNEVSNEVPENMKHQKPALAGIGVTDKNSATALHMQWSATLIILLMTMMSSII
ncbi:protein unzipped [Teleopsis dalmanni]|uniref:protein unzipped n=1 Tax=Teleopsis dalmanni TaxID=139649 RepID=UPI0018CF8CEF|nr:protein unzipped [Teleopsis dalmanni]XP_037949225.1 protein unzipped [Teleopsis dalmanni]